MKAVIMAGGEGTRLRPLTGSIPKPLVKLCGRHIVEYILDLLNKHGCNEAIFTLRYKGEMIESLFESEKYKNIKLRFSYEDEPLGTAGCVKKAAENFNDDFIVISGDALCDFNLTEAFVFHKNAKAHATIITKQVNDPREYGLVMSDSGKIGGFSEKPSYLNCISDYANTGVYILSPEALDDIPKNKMWDFARDVFPRMLKNEKKLMSYEESGYWCDIGEFDTYYSGQLDILREAVDCEIIGKKVSNEIFINSRVPENVSLIAPCYIGKNVRIEAGTTIEGCIIGDNVTISGNCGLYNSVILGNTTVMQGVTIDEAVICEGVKIKQCVTVNENAVIGDGSIIGERSVINSGVRIWQNKNIPANSIVNSDVIHGTRARIELNEKGITGDTNIDIDPAFMSKLGCSLSSLCPNNILVACDRNNASVSFKGALLAGISGAGAFSSDCHFAAVPMLIHLSDLMSADIIVHISAGAKTNISILNRYGLPLTRIQERKLEGGLNRSEYRTASCNDFGEVSNVSCVEELYYSMLGMMSGFKSKYNIFLNCKNSRLLKLISPIFERISNRTGEQLVITLNSGGTKAEFRLGMNDIISHEKLIMLACIDILKAGYDVALPVDFPSAADFLAQSYGQKIHRFFSCSNDDSDKQAREMAKSERYLNDGVYLSLFVLGWLSRDGLLLRDVVNSLPKFTRENRVVVINCPPQRILGKLCENNSGIGEGIIIDKDNNKVLLRSNKKGNALFLMAESMSQETAKELCDDVENAVKSLMSGQIE